MPLLLTTHYIHNIDDDILFGRTTIETLNDMIDHYKSPVGVQGRIVTGSDYQTGCFNATFANAFGGDFLCNSYGGVLESVKIFWRYRPYTENNGEDIHYSLSNNVECGERVRTLHNGKSTDRIENHGVDSVATYRTGGHFAIRGRIIRAWALRGVAYMNNSTAFTAYPDMTKESVDEYRREASFDL